MNVALVKSKLIACWYIMKGLGKPCFSQMGEDRILHFLFQSLGITNPTYLDIGANHPVNGSNSYFFYHRGSCGVCVEADPTLAAQIKRVRKRDICLNVGIGVTESTAADFYIFPNPYTGWNTFSKEEAEFRKTNWHPYEKIIKMPLQNINAILEKNFNATPDFISIDVEGLDFDILKSLDFNRHHPTALIVETLHYDEFNKPQKQQDLIDFVCSKGYSVYADTYVNTIFSRNT
ncbi:MAG: FkbM family methyltransferase [Ginsengibacter sp.]